MDQLIEKKVTKSIVDVNTLSVSLAITAIATEDDLLSESSLLDSTANVSESPMISARTTELKIHTSAPTKVDLETDNFLTPVNVFSEVIDMDKVERGGIADSRQPLQIPQFDRNSSNASALGDIVAAAGSPWFNPRLSTAALTDCYSISDFDDESVRELEQEESGSSVGASSRGSPSSSHGSIYQLKDMNTGKEYNIRDLEKNGSAEPCFKIGVDTDLFPSTGDLRQKKKNEDAEEDEDEDSTEYHHVENVDGPAKEKGEGDDNLPEKKGFFRRNRLDTGDSSIASAKGGKSVMPNNAKRRKEKKLKCQPIPEPRNTVKTNRKHKKESDFNPMLLISTIVEAHNGPIWCSSFSPDGKFLATGGKDGVVKIWEVAPQQKKEGKGSNLFDIGHYWKGQIKEEDVQDYDQNEEGVGDALGVEIIIVNPKPLQIFEEHSKDVVDLSWSNTGYLVSGSLDKTARLWHPSRSICLSIFTHPDAVVSVSFSPIEDRYFLTGGFDKKLRIWDIPNGRVSIFAPVPAVITTARYRPDGKSVAAGLLNGKVFFYNITESADFKKLKLTYYTQITTKQKGRKAGKKVTGLTFLRNLSDDKVADMPDPMGSPRNTKRKGRISGLVRNITTPMKKKKIQQQLLITTNDSRLRLVGMNDFCMVRKYKGHSNTCLQIRARFSESGEFIISGSESKGACTIWNTATKRNPLNMNVTGIHMYDKVKAREWFEATTADPPIVTEASFVPSKSAKESILSSGLFPTMVTLNNINHDFSSAAIVACDYEGTMRIFLRRSCIDAVSYAAGPAGHTS
eukprot:scaffold2355_cov267-Chaetoceros_neogracile.AAC.15